MDARKRTGIILNAMNHRSAKLIFSLLVLAAVFLILQPASTSAHNGGEPRLVDVEAGDFRLSVWTLPVPLKAGDLNFIVFVAESSASGGSTFVRANTPVLNADIKLTITPDDGGKSLVVYPSHARSVNKLFYEAYFRLDEVGSYKAVVLVESNGKTGTANFDFDLLQGAADINWFRYSGIAVLVVAIGWFVWQVQLDRLEDEA